MRSHSNGSEQAYKRSSRASDTSSSLYSGDGDGPSLHDSSLIDSDDDNEYGTESVSTASQSTDPSSSPLPPPVSQSSSHPVIARLNSLLVVNMSCLTHSHSRSATGKFVYAGTRARVLLYSHYNELWLEIYVIAIHRIKIIGYNLCLVNHQSLALGQLSSAL